MEDFWGRKKHWGFLAQDVEEIVKQDTGVVGEYIADGVVTKSLAQQQQTGSLVCELNHLVAQ